VLGELIAVAALAADRPAIRWDGIPFPAARKRQMRAYSRRHYGLDRLGLRAPKVVVEHMTANSSYRATWNTFARNAPDPELRELPGTCAHFVIDQRGRISQLVSLRYMCRHTVGLNWTSIGIEHVGTSDASLMGNRRQLRASLRLTRWLMERHGIAERNVIGHNESRSSPYHRERVARLRKQTHGDMRRATMIRYRRML
jgi:N-acetylmuramoyl-L-alanine amidase